MPYQQPSGYQQYPSLMGGGGWGGWPMDITYGTTGGGDPSNVQAGRGWGWGGLPWGTFGESPFGNFGVPGGPKKQQQWWNVMLPWMQASLQRQQWGSEFDWRKAMDEWTKGFQESQFGWEKEQDVWARGLQEKQLEEQKEQANLEAFGRRWKPSTRWM